MVLIELANTLQIYFPDALVARFGGEEFCILYGNSSQIFHQRLEALIQDIADTELNILSQTIQYTISLGVVNADANIHELIRRADKCLYQAKSAGRNQLVLEG